MALTVVVGGQYGSEGKGKLVSYLACQAPGRVAVVRSGGSNAGHTAEGHGNRWLLRQLPSGAIEPRAELFLAAGMQIDPDILLAELRTTAVDPQRMRIDRNATLIEPRDLATERNLDLESRIASTLTGTGAAVARKVLRSVDVRTAADVDELKPFIADTSAELNQLLDEGATVIAEGTQGAGLSLHHGRYPYVTGRDTSAAGVLSETGLAPALLGRVIMVVRTYPIRVGGNSGPFPGEITWGEIAARSGRTTPILEHTTVTGRARRVAEFDWDQVTDAVRLNRPDELAIHGLDYLDVADLGASHLNHIGTSSRRFVERVEEHTGVRARYLFTGPAGHQLIDLGGPSAAGAAPSAEAPRAA